MVLEGAVPKLGPEPLILSRKEVDALYEILAAVKRALEKMGVDYICTGGSLLGAVRQHSVLFCDDDIDVAIVETGSGQGRTLSYDRVRASLGSLLGSDFIYSIKPWEGGDKIRLRRMPTVFLDLFTIRRYASLDELRAVLSVKKNGLPQPAEYVSGIVRTIEGSAFSQGEDTPLFPCWHFATRKAVEMWPKEVYREHELLPIVRDLKMGPVTGIAGPRTPVLLLKRAFGSDCFDVYYQSRSHKLVGKNKAAGGCSDRREGEELAPLVLEGGTWEDGVKLALEEPHYLPMQPVLRASRRPTLHGRQQLFRYLELQSAKETAWQQQQQQQQPEARGAEGEGVEVRPRVRPRRSVYMDGVFDLFHVGHLEAIRQCAALGTRVIIGVTGDADAAGYKRPPIIAETDRAAVVGALREVDEVVCPCPLVVTQAFMEERRIDLVVHGFANDADAKRQAAFFEAPARHGRFQRIQYYDGLSTTGIIAKIRALPATEAPAEAAAPKPVVGLRCPKPTWFGAAIAAATDSAATLTITPALRETMRPWLEKAAARRDAVLGAAREATGAAVYDKSLGCLLSSGLACEGEFAFDTVAFALRAAFLRSCGLNERTADLRRLHESDGAKDTLLRRLTQTPTDFQMMYDRFVRSVCAPRLAALFHCNEVYYQAFPCVRVVQPHEFSIGPHADSMYGHHPCSINFYVPLTEIGGTSALFLEGAPGRGDWHPIVGGYGIIKHFAGALCLHWTTENKTPSTRVSLDFRLIPGPVFHTFACGGALPGGATDVYRGRAGYYSRCTAPAHGDRNCCWERDGELLAPDARVGFPWTAVPR